MATEMISMRFEKSFLKKIDRAVKKGSYQSRTEFVRQAIREKTDEENLFFIKQFFAELRKDAQPVSKEKYESVRNNIIEKLRPKS